MGLLFLIITLQVYSVEESDNVYTQDIRSKRYTPDWVALDARPAPVWYDSGKIGIFVHWGPYAVPCYTTEWFWFELENGNYFYMFKATFLKNIIEGEDLDEATRPNKGKG